MLNVTNDDARLTTYLEHVKSSSGVHTRLLVGGGEKGRLLTKVGVEGRGNIDLET